MSSRRPTGLQITLVALLLLHTTLAIVFLRGAPLRFSGPAYTTAEEILSIHQWGWAFALGAVSLLVALKHRAWLVGQLIAGMFLYLFWAICFILSAAHYPTAGLTGAPLWGFAAVVQLAAASTVYGPRIRR